MHKAIMIKRIIWLIIIMFIITSCYKTELEKVEVLEKPENISDIRKILAIWDSLTAWYNLNIKDSYPYKLNDILSENWYKYEVINAGVSWDTSKNLLSRIWLYEEKYDLVLLNIWWNDALRSLDLKKLENNILDIVKQFWDSKIIMFSIDLPANYWLEYRKELKDIYKKIGKKKEINFYWSFFEWLDYNSDFLSDGIHPNKKWYEKIAKNIYNYLLENNNIKND